jgi:hypothetical protein
LTSKRGLAKGAWRLASDVDGPMILRTSSSMIFIISSHEKLVGGKSFMASRFGVVPSDLASFRRVSSTEGASLRVSARFATNDLYSLTESTRFARLGGHETQGKGVEDSTEASSRSDRNASAQCRTETVIVIHRSG